MEVKTLFSRKIFNEFSQSGVRKFSRAFGALLPCHPLGALFSGCPSFNFELDPPLQLSGFLIDSLGIQQWTANHVKEKKVEALLVGMAT